MRVAGRGLRRASAFQAAHQWLPIRMLDAAICSASGGASPSARRRTCGEQRHLARSRPSDDVRATARASTLGLVSGGIPGSPDQWDGYVANRNRIFELWAKTSQRNHIVLAGDIHSSWAAELTVFPGNPASYGALTAGARSLPGAFGQTLNLPQPMPELTVQYRDRRCVPPTDAWTSE